MRLRIVDYNRVLTLHKQLAEALSLLQAYLEQHMCIGEKARCEECTRARVMLREQR